MYFRLRCSVFICLYNSHYSIYSFAPSWFCWLITSYAVDLSAYVKEEEFKNWRECCADQAVYCILPHHSPGRRILSLTFHSITVDFGILLPHPPLVSLLIKSRVVTTNQAWILLQKSSVWQVPQKYINRPTVLHAKPHSIQPFFPLLFLKDSTHRIS